MATASVSVLSILLSLILGFSAVGGALPTQVDYTYEAAYILDGQEDALSASLTVNPSLPALELIVNGDTLMTLQDSALSIPPEAMELLNDVSSYLTTGGLEADLSVLLPYLADFPDFNAFTLTSEYVRNASTVPFTRFTFETTAIRLMTAAHRWAAYHACDAKLMEDVKNLKVFSLPSVQKLLEAQELTPETAFTALMQSLATALSDEVNDAYGYNLSVPIKVTADFNTQGVLFNAHAEAVLSSDSYAWDDPDDAIVFTADLTNENRGNPKFTVLVTRGGNTLFSGLFNVLGSQVTLSAHYASMSSYAEGFDFLLSVDGESLSAGLSIHDDYTNPSYTLNVKDHSISFLYLESDYNYYDTVPYPFVRGVLTWQDDGTYAVEFNNNTMAVTGKGALTLSEQGISNTLELTSITYSSYDDEEDMKIGMRLEQLLRQENGAFVLTDHFEAAPLNMEEEHSLVYDDTHTLTVR